MSLDIKELNALSRTVEAMTGTQEALTQRLDQVIKLFDEKGEQLTTLIDRLLVIAESWEKALSDLDKNIDDLAAITAVYTTELQLLREEEAEQEGA